MIVGTLMAQSQDFAPTYPLDLFGTKINAYTGVFALTANLIVTAVLTLVLRRSGPADAADETRTEDFDELAEGAEPPPRGATVPAA
jgi:hypothetical protein